MTGAGPAPASIDVVVPAALDGQRVDRVVAMLADVTRAVAAALVAEGLVLVEGRPVRARSAALREGQRLEVAVPAPAAVGPSPDDSVPFTVVYEDGDLVVVDKPAGVVVHHGAGRREGTLVDGLLARYPELSALPAAGVGDAERPGIVHRIDKGTSGLLVVARSPAGFASLSRQLRQHTAGRRYLALVAGTVEADNGVIDAPIGRSARRPDRMTVSSRGRPARTAYEVRGRYHEPVAASLIEAALETGRTHQVRVHVAAIGHPVIGDDRYGGPRARPAGLTLPPAGRVLLHAYQLEVDHPDGRRLSWESPLPDDFTAVLAQLR